MSAGRVPDGTSAELENSRLGALDIQVLQSIMNFDMPAVGSLLA